MNPKVDNVFLTMTPYHLLLSYGIASTECRGARNWLIVIADFPNVDVCLDIIENSNDSPFDRILVYRGMYHVYNKYRRSLRVLLNVRSIEELVRSLRMEQVFVANDMRPEGQALVHFAKTLWGATCVYVEDGAAIYSSVLRGRPNRLVRYLKSLLYGVWWEDIRVQGTSRAIDEVRAIFPEAVRPELQRLPVKKLDSWLISRIRIERQKVNRFLFQDGKGVEVDDLNVIILLPHSHTITKQRTLAECLDNALRWFRRKGLLLALKYHPREERHYLSSLSSEIVENAVIIPQELPIEFLYALQPANLRYVCGDWSTGLLTARWLLRNVAVLRTDLWVHEDEGLLRTFDVLKIRPISSVVSGGQR